jgi:hypothetical protein
MPKEDTVSLSEIYNDYHDEKVDLMNVKNLSLEKNQVQESNEN